MTPEQKSEIMTTIMNLHEAYRLVNLAGAEIATGASDDYYDYLQSAEGSIETAVTRLAFLLAGA